jgi:hypothetical protein
MTTTRMSDVPRVAFVKFVAGMTRLTSGDIIVWLIGYPLLTTPCG